jgi:hypothetical protein
MSGKPTPRKVTDDGAYQHQSADQNLEAVIAWLVWLNQIFRPGTRRRIPFQRAAG